MPTNRRDEEEIPRVVHELLRSFDTVPRDLEERVLRLEDRAQGLKGHAYSRGAIPRVVLDRARDEAEIPRSVREPSRSVVELARLLDDIPGGAIFTHGWPIDIPGAVGADTAYVGFTGSTGGAASVQAIEAWTYSAPTTPPGAVPEAPTNVRVR